MSKWDSIKTKHDYPADQVISALQKEIRRGKEEEAMFWTYELLVSSKELTDKYWERIITIAVEDVGFADPDAIQVVSTLKKEYYANFEKVGDQMLLALFASAYLARSDKDRYLDEAKHYIRDAFEKHNKRPEIPNYAIDKHTKAGQEKGLDFKHFLKEGTKLNPISKSRNKKYLKYVAEREGVDISDLD